MGNAPAPGPVEPKAASTSAIIAPFPDACLTNPMPVDFGLTMSSTMSRASLARSTVGGDHEMLISPVRENPFYIGQPVFAIASGKQLHGAFCGYDDDGGACRV